MISAPNCFVHMQGRQSVGPTTGTSTTDICSQWRGGDGCGLLAPCAAVCRNGVTEATVQLQPACQDCPCWRGGHRWRWPKARVFPVKLRCNLICVHLKHTTDGIDSAICKCSSPVFTTICMQNTDIRTGYATLNTDIKSLLTHCCKSAAGCWCRSWPAAEFFTVAAVSWHSHALCHC